jgi:PAS domain S-box-containing protein
MMPSGNLASSPHPSRASTTQEKGMSVIGHPDEGQQPAGPRPGRLGLLFVLVNVPALVLLGWLALDCLRGPDSLASALPGRLIRLAALAGVLAGNWLLYRLVCRASTHLTHSLAFCSDQLRAHRALLDSAADGILTVAETGRITSANPAAARMFGYRPDELIGQPLAVLLPGDPGSLPSEVHSGEQRVLGVGQAIEARRKDDSRFAVSLAVSKTRVAGRGVYAVIVHDLTEVQQARRAAEAASRAKSNFLVRMSHEVRTPLGGILGMAELLRDSPLSEGQRRCLETIRQSAEAVLAVFAQVIDFAQIGSGEWALGERSFSLSELVRETTAPLVPLAHGKGLGLHVHLDPGLPDRFRGDPLRLSQALAALVGNAVKFTDQGEVVVCVSSAACGLAGQPKDTTAKPQAPDVHLRFTVRDTGIGIPAETLQRIFEPFEQGDTSSTRKHGGVGLGLSLAARLAALMGGRIDVDSQPGRGSVFRLSVPLRPDDPAGPARPGTALVVLAHEEERRALERHLAGWGYRAVGAPTGRDALAELLRAAVEGNPFSLVLIAEHLPDLSAREVLRRLRGRHDRPPPAILLGHSEKDLPAPAGFVAVLSRSACPHELGQAIRRALAQSDTLVSEPA